MEHYRFDAALHDALQRTCNAPVRRNAGLAGRYVRYTPYKGVTHVTHPQACNGEWVGIKIISFSKKEGSLCKEREQTGRDQCCPPPTLHGSKDQKLDVPVLYHRTVHHPYPMNGSQSKFMLCGSACGVFTLQQFR